MTDDSKKEFSHPLIDFETVNEFLNQYDGVRAHLLGAGRELLFALRAFLASILETLEKENPQGKAKWDFLYSIDGYLGFIQSQLIQVGSSSKSEGPQTLAHKISALESIRSVMEEEMKVSTKTSSKSSKDKEVQKVRLEVLGSICNVLDREIARAKKDLGGEKKKSKNSNAKSESAKKSANSKSARSSAGVE